MTIRKNFIFDEKTAHTLEEIAQEEGITQTEALKRAIEQMERERKRKKRLEALEGLKKTPPANLGDMDVREARIERALKHAR